MARRNGEGGERSRTASTTATAKKALRMKQASEPLTKKPDDRTPREGLHPIENKDQAPSGALDHGGQHPAMQRSKFARQ